MSRYVGLFALLLGTLLMVNFASDFLYARAIAAQTDEEDEPVVTATVAARSLPITGLIRSPTGRWGQGRVIGTSATPISDSTKSCTSSVASAQR
jgi:hypothetical protein